MGYRSEGTLVMMREAYDRAATLDMLGTFPSLLKELTPDIDSSYVTWEYDGYKMYSSYPVIAEFESWLEYLGTDDEDNLPWLIGFEQPHWKTGEPVPVPPSDVFQYIRLGEEYGDIEERGQLGVLCVERSIERY